MTRNARPMLLFAALGALLSGALVAGGAHAAPAEYTCDGGAPMQADFSPRAAQVRFEGQHWPLKRVRSGREARYVGADVSVVVVRNQATLTRKGQPPLTCKLVVQALRPEALGTAAPAR
jgi:Membrane-bound lysozyme-inhibitor of c-type lysozyme